MVGALMISGMVIGARHVGLLQPIELLAYDKLVVSHSQVVANQRFLLIGMTEPDIHRWGYPLSDDFFADLLTRVVSWHPRAVGVDIYRDIPTGPQSGSDKLAALLKAHPEIVWIFKMAEGKDHPMIPPPAAVKGTDQAVLADTAPDPGQIARRGLLYADDGKDSFPTLGMAIAQRFLAVDGIQPAAGDTDDDMRLGKAVIPPLDDTRGPYMKLDNRGYQVLLDYREGARPFKKIAIADAMDQDVSAEVKGRAVLIGDFLESVNDNFSTPFNTGFADQDPDRGLEIHAQLAEQLIREAKGLSPMLKSLPRMGENIWIVVWAVGGAVLGLAIRSTVPAVAGGGFGLAAIGAIVYVAFGRSLLLPFVPAAFAWSGTAALTNQLLHAATNRARARLRRSFEHYLPSAVIEQMVAADDLPHLGGERREISVLFTDVAGFTTFSEQMRAGSAGKHDQRVFRGRVRRDLCPWRARQRLYRRSACWPFSARRIPQADHADRAVAAALDIDKFANQFIIDQAARGVEFGHTRIGVHTGFAFVGNVGTKQRLQYTALGDMLNTGSRLEGLNKTIGTRICLLGRHRSRRPRSIPAARSAHSSSRDASTRPRSLTPIDPEHATRIGCALRSRLPAPPRPASRGDRSVRRAVPRASRRSLRRSFTTTARCRRRGHR